MLTNTNGFVENFDEFVHRQIEVVLPDQVSEAYSEMEREAKRLYKQIYSALPAEAKEALVQYDEIRTFQEYLLEEMFYKKGFSEGIKFAMSPILHGGTLNYHEA